MHFKNFNIPFQVVVEIQEQKQNIVHALLLLLSSYYNLKKDNLGGIRKKILPKNVVISKHFIVYLRRYFYCISTYAMKVFEKHNININLKMPF